MLAVLITSWRMLSVASASACFQHQVFSRHEREFCCQVGLDHSVVDDEPAGDVLHDVECPVEGEKRLWNTQAAVGGVVRACVRTTGSRPYRARFRRDS